MWWWTVALAADLDQGLEQAGGEEREEILSPEDLSVDGPEQSAIINGGKARIDDWPMAGGLIVHLTATVPNFGELTSRAFMCSSTLIAPDVVLLAAHCVDIEGLIDIATQGGVEVQNIDNLKYGWSRQEELYHWDMVDSAINGPKRWPDDTVFASSVIFHPGFDLATLQTGLAENADIALMFLEEPVLDVPFALLPTEEEAEQIEVGSPVTIVGWGQQAQDVTPGSVGIKMMAESTVDEIAPYEFQVGKAYESGRKCHGDSGGPTFFDVETDSAISTRVIGVTSHAYDITDCNVTGGVDTRVDYFLKWIDGRMREGCEDGSRAWCETPGIIPPPDANGMFPWELLAAEGEEEGKGKGCGCNGAAGGSGPLGLAGLLLALGLRRRR